MFNLFVELHPDIKVSYETYRSIMERDFNIAFVTKNEYLRSVCSKKRKAEIEKKKKNEIKKFK